MSKTEQYPSRSFMFYNADDTQLNSYEELLSYVSTENRSKVARFMGGSWMFGPKSFSIVSGHELYQTFLTPLPYFTLEEVDANELAHIKLKLNQTFNQNI